MSTESLREAAVVALSEWIDAHAHAAAAAANECDNVEDALMGILTSAGAVIDEAKQIVSDAFLLSMTADASADIVDGAEALLSAAVSDPDAWVSPDVDITTDADPEWPTFPTHE